MSCRRCCGCNNCRCNNCRCNNCRCNNCGCNNRRNCRCLANNVQRRINDLFNDIEDLQCAFDELLDEGCVRGIRGFNNRCECHRCGRCF